MTLTEHVLDVRPVRRDRRFRRLWIGGTAAMIGQQVAIVAILYQVWQLTGSPMWVGAVGLAQAVPMVARSLLGGTLADAFDRRRGTIVLLSTPDSHRGRVGAVDNVIGAAGPHLGNARAGFVAGLTSSSFALVAGGLLCVAGIVAVALRSPALRTFTRREVKGRVGGDG